MLTSAKQPFVVEPVTLIIRICVEPVLNQLKLWKWQKEESMLTSALDTKLGNIHYYFLTMNEEKIKYGA